MKNDQIIRREVLNELDWDPKVYSPLIKADVKDGVVRLYGKVNCEAERKAAEKIARNVPGVKDVIQQIELMKCRKIMA